MIARNHKIFPAEPLLIITFFLLTVCSYAQREKHLPRRSADSLDQLIAQAKHDTLKIKAYINKAQFSYKCGDSATAAQSIFKANELAVKGKFTYFEARTLQSLGRLYMNYGCYDVSNDYCMKALVIAKRIKHNHLIQDLYKKISINMTQMKKLEISLRYSDSALAVSLKTNNNKVITENYSNLAEGYVVLNRFNEAINIYFKALSRAEKNKDSSNMALIYSNLGSLYHSLGKTNEERNFYRKSLRINPLKDEQDFAIKTSSFLGIAAAHHADGNLDSAAFYYRKILITIWGTPNSVAINGYVEVLLRRNQLDSAFFYADLILSNLKNTQFFGYRKAPAILNMASVLVAQKKYSKALPYALQANELGKEIAAVDIQARSAETLCKIYEELGDLRKALYYSRETKRYDDSLKNNSNREEMLRRSMEYAFSKEQFGDSLQHAEEISVQQVQLAAKQAELSSEKRLKYVMAGVLVLIAAFLLFIVRAYRQKNEANKMSLQQKKETERAYEKLHEKNKEVLDSIHYAKRIQRALITNEKYLEKNLSRLQKK